MLYVKSNHLTEGNPAVVEGNPKEYGLRILWSSSEKLLVPGIMDGKTGGGKESSSESVDCN
jgi:hypothetical protein